MSNVFLSYSHEDRDFAELLKRQLEDDQHVVWTDATIQAGNQWRVEIDTAIRKASAVVVIMTPDAKRSEYVTYEWGYALGVGVTVIPVFRKETSLHPRLELIQYLDFTAPANQPWPALRARLREHDVSAKDIPPIGGLHGYSGEWRINTAFDLWQGQPVSAPNRVVFQGSMFLLLAADGRHGSGTQVGNLSAAFTDWAATYQVANVIRDVHLTDAGVLELTLQQLARTRISGQQPPPPYRDDLFGDRQFRVRLRAVPGNSQRLTGDHAYVAGSDYQIGDEKYDYVGLRGQVP
jgi:hypothetical protein